MATIESNPPIGVIDPLDGTEEVLVLQAGVLKRNPFADLWTWIKGKIESVTLAITLSGGSLNNAPVGATTPSTGAFTTLSAIGDITHTQSGINAFWIIAPDQAVEEKKWVWQAGSSVGAGVYRLRAVNDALTNGVSALTFQRTGISAVSALFGGNVAVTGAISATTTIKTGGYTVATLPAGSAGMRAYVTDATTPTWNVALTGGGAVVCPVFHNGTAWVSA